jgi:hypothetical protein
MPHRALLLCRVQRNFHFLPNICLSSQVSLSLGRFVFCFRSGQCIMKERPVQKVEAGWSAASAPLRCAGLRSATAALESNCGGVCGARGLQESIGESAGKWQFTLRERPASTRMSFPPKEETQMSVMVIWTKPLARRTLSRVRGTAIFSATRFVF